MSTTQNAKRLPPDGLHVVFDGIVEPVSPIATCPPDGSDNGPQRLPRLTVFFDDDAHSLPYLPGSGLRGRLRRLALDCVGAAARGVFPMGVNAYLLNAVGAIKGAEKEDKQDIINAGARRARNPLISLFGAGAPWLCGRASVGHAIPTSPIPADVIAGARADDFARDPERLRFLDEGGVRTYLKYARANQARVALEREIKEIEREERKARNEGDRTRAEALKKEAEAKVAAIEAAIKDMEPISSNSILMPLAGYETIPVGARLGHRMVLSNVTVEEIGLFTDALGRLALEPFVGGHTRPGCGVIRARYSIRIREHDRDSFDPAGDIRIEPFDTVHYPPILFEALDAWRTAAADGRYDFSEAA